MKITQISYRELKALPGYENVAMEMTATIDPDIEDFEMCMTKLKTRVRRELKAAAKEKRGD